ncbi:MAG: GIY-YIG nuclease family protein [Salinivirgaceae bacterium]
MEKEVIVYALKSQVIGRIYVGMTTSLRRRIKEHNSGQNESTKAY